MTKIIAKIKLKRQRIEMHILVKKNWGSAAITQKNEFWEVKISLVHFFFHTFLLQTLRILIQIILCDFQSISYIYNETSFKFSELKFKRQQWLCLNLSANTSSNPISNIIPSYFYHEYLRQSLASCMFWIKKKNKQKQKKTQWIINYFNFWFSKYGETVINHQAHMI